MTIHGLEPGKRPALVVSECQNGIVNTAYVQSPLAQQVQQRGVIAEINTLAAVFRDCGYPVIHATVAMPTNTQAWIDNCYLAHNIKRAGRLVTGTPEVAVHDDIQLAPTDIVCERWHGMTAFTGTELHSILRAFSTDTVVLCGVSTNIALPGGTAEAVGLGYQVVIPEECTAGSTPETHEMQITMHLSVVASVTTSAAVTEALRAPTADSSR